MNKYINIELNNKEVKIKIVVPERGWNAWEEEEVWVFQTKRIDLQV